MKIEEGQVWYGRTDKRSGRQMWRRVTCVNSLWSLVDYESNMFTGNKVCGIKAFERWARGAALKAVAKSGFNLINEESSIAEHTRRMLDAKRIVDKLLKEESEYMVRTHTQSQLERVRYILAGKEVGR